MSAAKKATAGLLTLCALTAHATTLLRVDVDDLARRAPVVVRGKVAKVQSHWSGDHMRILTDVDITVDEALKGTPEQTVRITQPGGTVGDIGQKIAGLASFKEGEQVVVFLERQSSPGYRVAGMAQGKFKLTPASDGKGTLAVPESTGDAELLDSKTHAPVAPNAEAMSLESLRSHVKAAATPKAAE